MADVRSGVRHHQKVVHGRCLTEFPKTLGHFGTILADPPWLFANRTGKVAPEHKRLYRYQTMTNEEIIALPVKELVAAEPPVSLGAKRAESRWGCK